MIFYSRSHNFLYSNNYDMVSIPKNSNRKTNNNKNTLNILIKSSHALKGFSLKPFHFQKNMLMGRHTLITYTGNK